MQRNPNHINLNGENPTLNICNVVTTQENVISPSTSKTKNYVNRTTVMHQHTRQPAKLILDQQHSLAFHQSEYCSTAQYLVGF